jgi:uncharacterized protein YndB with AHSA1/START domain
VIPVALDTYISAPREDVYDLVGDLSRRVAWTDHFQREYHLARVRYTGLDAAARFRTDPPFRKELFTELVIAEYDRPRRIVEHGKEGRLNRSRVEITWNFTQEGPSLTRVEFEMRAEPHRRLESVQQALGGHGYYKRQWATALDRLRMIFEEPPEGELARATIAGYEPLKAARYG